MSTGLIPFDRMSDLVLHAIAGAMDEDDDEIAANVRPLFEEGDVTDGFAFLCGVFAAIEQLTGPRTGRQQTRAERVHIHAGSDRCELRHCGGRSERIAREAS